MTRAQSLHLRTLEARVVRLAGLFRDLFESDGARDETVDETREDLFTAVDALREARK